MARTWRPISELPKLTCPDWERTVEESARLLVWVADARPAGTVAFGCVRRWRDRDVRWQAEGYGGGHRWKITHWMALPGAPKK